MIFKIPVQVNRGGLKLFTALFVLLCLISCTNIIEDEIKPVEKTEVKSDKKDDKKNVQISGLLKLTGALPSEIVENLSLSGSYLSLPGFTGQARTAFPSIPTSGFTYEIKAINTNDETDFYTGSPSEDLSSYTITIPATSTEKEYKIQASVRLSGFESEYIFLSGQSEEFPISLTSPVMTKDVTLKPLTGESGIMDLAVDVSGSGIRSAKATVNFSEYSHTYIQADMEDDILTFHTGTHTEDELEDGLSSGAWPVTFEFYKSTDCTGEKAYSFTEVVNIFSNLATNTWVQNGSEPWFVTTGTGASKTTTCRITAAMVEGFKLTEIYVDPTATASTESGTFLNPCKTFSKAIEKLTDANKDYTIKIRGTLSGSGFQIPASLKNDGSGTYNAKSLTLCGATGLNSSGVPQDSLKLDSEHYDGNVLRILSDVPVILETLLITDAWTDWNSSGGIWMENGAKLTLSDGVLIKDNSAEAGIGGALNVGGIFKMKGSAYIPAGVNGVTGVGKNDVYIPDGKKITIAGKLTPPAACTDGIVATITPASYTAGTQLIELDTGVTDTSLAEAAAHFAVTQPVNGTNLFFVSNEGKLATITPVFSFDNGEEDGSQTNPDNGKVYDVVKYSYLDDDNLKVSAVNPYEDAGFSIELLVDGTSGDSTARTVDDGYHTLTIRVSKAGYASVDISKRVYVKIKPVKVQISTDIHIYGDTGGWEKHPCVRNTLYIDVDNPDDLYEGEKTCLSENNSGTGTAVGYSGMNYYRPTIADSNYVWLTAKSSTFYFYGDACYDYCIEMNLGVCEKGTESATRTLEALKSNKDFSTGNLYMSGNWNNYCLYTFSVTLNDTTSPEP